MIPAFLVTTYKNVLIFMKDRLYKLESDKGVYYGVAWSDELLFVLRRNNNQGEVLAIYNKTLDLVREIELEEVYDSHQMVYSQGQLWLTKTSTNQVVTIDVSRILNKRVKIKKEYYDIGDVRDDVNHINALTVLEDKREIVLCLSNLWGGETEWQVRDMDTWQLKDSYIKGLAAHNYLNGFYTSSKDGYLYTPEKKIRYGSWLRGLSATAGLLLTSISITVPRDERAREFAAKVLLLDETGEKLLQWIKIYDVGQINEVKFLSEGESFWNGVSLDLPEFIAPEIRSDSMARKLEIGSGNRPLPGYEHLDFDPKCPDLDYCCSMDSIPVPDNTFEEIRSIHSLEHIGWRKGKPTLAEWFRVLAPGGKVHIACPNLRWIMQAYLENSKTWIEDLNRMHPDEKKHLMVKGSYAHTLWANFKIFSSGSGDDLHMAGYDAFLLTSLMAEVGFCSIKVLHDGDSLIVEGYK